MAIITNNYFIVKVKYTKQLDNGTFKRVSEPYLVAGFSFTDAEASIYENLGTVIRGEFTVTDIKRVEYHDIFDETGGTADKYFVAKISYESVDIDSDKAKRVTQSFLVGATTIEQATDVIKEELSTLMVDYKIIGITESPIVEIFPIKENLDKEISRTPRVEVEFTSNQTGESVTNFNDDEEDDFDADDEDADETPVTLNDTDFDNV
jgi:hypothetical protein